MNGEVVGSLLIFVLTARPRRIYKQRILLPQDMTLHKQVIGCRRFEARKCLFLQGCKFHRKIAFRTLKTKTLHRLETLEMVYTMYIYAATDPRKTNISATRLQESKTESENFSKVDSIRAFRKGTHRFSSCTNGIVERPQLKIMQELGEDKIKKMKKKDEKKKVDKGRFF